MNRIRSIAWPFYLTALVIIAFPVMELVLTIMPWSPSVVSWRFGSVGLLARAVTTPLVGLALLFGTAVVLEHRRVLQAVVVVGFLGGLTLLATLALFLVDLMDFRQLVRPESTLAFNASSAMVVMKLVGFSVVLFAFGVSALLVSRSTAGKKKRKESDPAELMAFKRRPGE